MKPGLIRRSANFWEGGEHHRIGQRFRRQGLHGTRAMRTFEGCTIWRAFITLANVGLINDAIKRSLPIRHRDQDPPRGRAADKPTGAVNRIQHPSEARCPI